MEAKSTQAEKTGKIVKEGEINSQKEGGANLRYQNYVPRHSMHGRSNSKTFGADHEPGTFR